LITKPQNIAELQREGQNLLHQFPRSSKSVTSPQQVSNFSVYGEATGKRV